MPRPLTVALCFLALAAPGCGGDDPPATSPAASTPSPTAKPAETREEFIARADEICRATNEQIAEINERVRTLTGEQLPEAGELFAEGRDLQEAALERFEELPVPAGDEDRIATLVRSYREQVALIGRLADAARRADAQAFAAIRTDLERVSTRASGLAEGYGFEACGGQGSDG